MAARAQRPGRVRALDLVALHPGSGDGGLDALAARDEVLSIERIAGPFDLAVSLRVDPEDDLRWLTEHPAVARLEVSYVRSDLGISA